MEMSSQLHTPTALPPMKAVVQWVQLLHNKIQPWNVGSTASEMLVSIHRSIQRKTQKTKISVSPSWKPPITHQPLVSIGQEAGWAPEPFWTRWRRQKIHINTLSGVGEGEAGRGMKLTTHLHLVPRLRMRGVILLLPRTSLLRGT
jgi:hypothetical protein